MKLESVSRTSPSVCSNRLSEKFNGDLAISMIIYKGTHGNFGPITLAVKNRELISTFD